MPRDFNGTSDFISIPDSAVWDEADSVTFGAWFFPQGSDTSDVLMGRWDENAAVVWNLAYNSNGGQLRLDSSSSGSFQSGNQLNSVASISDNVWSHIVGVCDAGNSRNRIYINGGLDSTDSAITAGLVNTNVAVRLGGSARFAGVARFFDGYIAHAFVYMAALHTDEINALAKGVSPLLIRADALVGYWPLYGVDSPEPDYSRGRNAGTLTGTTTPNVAVPSAMPMVLGHMDQVEKAGLAGEITDAATVYFDLQPASADVQEHVDSATVYFDLQPQNQDIAAYVDSATVYLELTNLGGECFSTWNAALLGEGDAWASLNGDATAEWSGDPETDFSAGSATAEGLHC